MGKSRLDEMALSRDKWKAKLSSRLSGGLGEWYKHLYADRAGLASDPKNGHLAARWEMETLRLVGPDLIDAYDTRMKAHHGRPRAFQEVEQQLRAGEASFRRWARSCVERVFRTKVDPSLVAAADLEDLLVMARATLFEA